MKNLRAKKQISLGKKGLILCEGHTETNYFKGFITQGKYRKKFSAVGVEIYQPKNHSPVGLIKHAKDQIIKAKKEKSPYDFVWVVFDKDGHQNIPQAYSDAKDFNPEIKIAFSITCFEYYILLHFVKTTKSFKKCDDVISELKVHFPNYDKTNNIFNDLIDKHEMAISNGLWCKKQCQVDLDNGVKIYELSSYTDVCDLVQFLDQLQ